MTYRIAEVAELTGVPATTIRYYEDEGLLRPPEREPNGYRRYGDRDVARLRFVSRARNLDLPTDGLRALIALWEDDECAVVADRMRDEVARRLSDTSQRIAELTAFAGDLQQVLTRLEGDPNEGPCVDDECVCLDRMPVEQGLPMAPTAPAEVEGIACTLEPAARPQRMTDWRHLLGYANGRDAIAGGMSFRFPMDPKLAADLVDMAAAEHRCCSFFNFSLGITGEMLRLDITAPPGAAPAVAAIFGAPGHVPATDAGGFGVRRPATGSGGE